MHGNPNAVFDQNDSAAAFNLGDAIQSATNKGAALSDVLSSVADAKPATFTEAAGVARTFAREFAAA